MALDGERSIRKMTSIGSGTSVVTVPTVNANPFPGCCNDYVFKELADSSGISAQNDVSTVIWWFNPTATAASLLLKQWNGSAWVTIATLTTSNTTYGTFNQFGYFKNAESQNFISLEIAWSKVLSVVGTGS